MEKTMLKIPPVPISPEQPPSTYLLEAIAALLTAGLRTRELALLRWPDVDLARGVITVEGKGRRRDFAIPRPALNVLRVRAANLTVFAPGEVRRFVALLCRLGSNPLRLRHLAATNLVREGMSLPEILRILSHSRVHTTVRRYTKLTPKADAATPQPTKKSRRRPRVRKQSPERS
jgi:integrase